MTWPGIEPTRQRSSTRRPVCVSVCVHVCVCVSVCVCVCVRAHKTENMRGCIRYNTKSLRCFSPEAMVVHTCDKQLGSVAEHPQFVVEEVGEGAAVEDHHGRQKTGGEEETARLREEATIRLGQQEDAGGQDHLGRGVGREWGGWEGQGGEDRRGKGGEEEG